MIIEYSLDDYRAYCQEYAEGHPIRENGVIVGHEYPNGEIVYCEDDIFEDNEEEEEFY